MSAPNPSGEVECICGAPLTTERERDYRVCATCEADSQRRIDVWAWLHWKRRCQEPAVFTLAVWPEAAKHFPQL